jgi:pyruvate/2-oxoglutarate dehydrogenase complex dihydrolipoamide acyltransferase (E2) component
MKKTLLTAALVLAASTAQAQADKPAAAPAPAPAAAPAQAATSDLDKSIALMRKDMRNEKADVLAKSMQLDASQAAIFWPIYKKYEADAQKLGDEKLAILKEIAAKIDTLTDAQAVALLDRNLALEGKKLALVTKYKGEMLKAKLPGKTVVRWAQIENRLGMVIQLSIASEIPIVY